MNSLGSTSVSGVGFGVSPKRSSVFRGHIADPSVLRIVHDFGVSPKQSLLLVWRDTDSPCAGSRIRAQRTMHPLASTGPFEHLGRSLVYVSNNPTAIDPTSPFPPS